MPVPVVSRKPQPTNIQSYSLPSSSLESTSELRLDACFYNPEVFEALDILGKSGMRVQPLAEIANDIFIPPRFKRIYVHSDHGVPFLQGSHIVHFRPADLKYLSRIHPKLEQCIIRANWVLVTRSGTAGRVMLSPSEWDGWAASEHILRIVPDEKRCSAGYLCSFLSSSFGQVQLTANIYGAVVDELTEQQAASVMVPLPETKEDRVLVQSIDTAMRQAVCNRSKAVALVNDAITQIRPSTETIADPKHFLLPTGYWGDDNDLRMDAGFYNSHFLHAIDLLSGVRTARLGRIAEVFMPPRFKRVYVEQEHGIPFLQGSHAVHFQAAGLKYLSSQSEKLDQLSVKAGWILVTRSGTVGRATICPDEWDGWTATEDLIRIVPNEKECPVGYLCAFLSSPLGQVQLTSQAHGAVVDHLTEEQVENILVPLPNPSLIQKIDLMMKRGMSVKSKAVELVNHSIEKLSRRFWGVRYREPTMKKHSSKSKRPFRITLPPRDYQPSKAEHEEEFDMPGASLKTVREAFFRPVKVKVVKKPAKPR